MKTLTLSIILCLTSTIVFAQSSPGPFLVSADIDRFIETQAKMSAEFEAIEDDLDDEDEGDSYEEIINSYMKALKDDRAVNIIKKYGWQPETYGQKMMAIAMGATYLMAKKQMKDMPAEQRTLVEETITKQYKTYVHPDDVEIVRPRLDDLEALFIEN